MRTRWLALAAVLATGGFARADDPIALKVLYAGNPGSEREKEFSALLSKHFAKVATGNYENFTSAHAKGHDVVILDWTSIYPRDEHGKIRKNFDGLNNPTPPKLSGEYDRPTILIGAAGGFVGQTLSLKIDWR
jgi:hypothetical protein